TRTLPVFSGTLGFQRLFMALGNSNAPDSQQRCTKEQEKKEWVHMPFRRVTRPPTIGRWRPGVPGRTFRCRRMAPSWTVERDDERLPHHDRGPERRDTCQAWSARRAHHHREYAKGAGTVQLWRSHGCEVRHPGWWRGAEATVSTWGATGEQSGDGLSWCRR